MKLKWTLLFAIFFIQWNSLIAQAPSDTSFTDSRDGKKYKIVQIGAQTWMAENLSYVASNECYFYENATFNGSKYGMLYGWKIANQVCPCGWHLPTNNEWETLAQNISQLKGPFAKDSLTWESVGKILKSDEGWPYNTNGTNDFGFSALPAGYRFAQGVYYSQNFSAYFWTADTLDDGNAIYRYINGGSNCLFTDNDMKIRAFSVRCIYRTK
jgi:uncharacterized protein (TIGR02145 family)